VLWIGYLQWHIRTFANTNVAEPIVHDLKRIIITPETAKHRVFAFQPLPFCPDHKLYAICCDDPFVLGVLSSAVHVHWSLLVCRLLGPTVRVNLAPMAIGIAHADQSIGRHARHGWPARNYRGHRVMVQRQGPVAQAASGHPAIA